MFLSGLWTSRDDLTESRKQKLGSPTKPIRTSGSDNSKQNSELTDGSHGNHKDSPDQTKSALTPLKSAMRQPRQIVAQPNVQMRLHRSNSMHDFVSSDYTPISVVDQRKQKTVRYDEMVKATEISKDSPPSHLNQNEETLLPVAKRERPIGGHDESYSEYPPTSPQSSEERPLPQQKTSPHDLRASIVNAKYELQARNREVNYRTTEIPMRQYTTPPSRPAVVRENSNHSIPQRMTQSYGGAPFANYINIKEQAQSSSTSSKPSTSYSTLPRPPYYPPTPDVMRQHLPVTQPERQNYGTLPKRVPLPSYEEVQAQRQRGTRALPPRYMPNRSSTLSRASDISQARFPPQSRPMTKPFDIHSALESNGTNGGSCSSSNPDSGYGSHATEYTGNDITAAWYHAGQYADSKMVSAKAVFPTFSPPPVLRPMIAVQRVTHTNMTSDV